MLRDIRHSVPRAKLARQVAVRSTAKLARQVAVRSTRRARCAGSVHTSLYRHQYQR